MNQALPDTSRNWLATKLDSFFEAVAPRYALARRQARTALSYRAAQPSLNRELAGQGAHPNSALIQRDAVTMMFEARDLSENVGFVVGHQRKLQMYGAGTLAYEPQTGDPGMDSEIQGFMEHFMETAHISGEHTLTRLIQLALLGMVRDRDSLLVWCRNDFGALKLQLVEADQIGELFSFINVPGYIQGVFVNPDGSRAGYRVYDRIGDMQYGNPQFVANYDGVFFYDPMRMSTRGITAYAPCIQNIRDKFEILGYEKIVVKELSETGIVTYTQTGQANPYDIDSVRTDSRGVKSFIRHAAAGVREYLGVGEKFEVVNHNRPSPTFQGFIKTLDQEDCQGLNLPYGFVVDLSEAGGAGMRVIAHVANREFERVRNDVLRPNLNRIRTVALMDAIERGEISRHPHFMRGEWMFPPPPTADIQRESDISIREVRAGLSTFAEQFAIYGQSRKRQWRIKMEEAVERHALAHEATKMLKAMGIDQTVSPDEIAALTDNPAQQNQDGGAPVAPAKTDAVAPAASADATAARLTKMEAALGELLILAKKPFDESKVNRNDEED